MSSSSWSGTRLRMWLRCKTATSNKETLSRPWVRAVTAEGETPTVMAKCFQRKTNPRPTEARVGGAPRQKKEKEKKKNTGGLTEGRVA